MVVEEVVSGTDLREAGAFTGDVIEVLASWTALDHARALTDLLIPEVVGWAADLEVGAGASIFVKVHFFRHL